MKKFDFYKIIKTTGFTKTKICELLDFSRPTLDKAIKQFAKQNKCSNKRLMILFSRLQNIELISNYVLLTEIELSSKYMHELENRFIDICTEGIDLGKTIESKYIIEDLEEECCSECGSWGYIRYDSKTGIIECTSCREKLDIDLYFTKKNIQY